MYTSMNAGEWSPFMEARVDLAKYPAACKLTENFIPLVQGPMTRRGGTYFMAKVKDSSVRAHLGRFEYSAGQAYQLEFGGGYVRFFSAHGQVVVSGVAAWSNATNYAVGDLAVDAGVNYYCIKAHINQAPPNATYWYALTGNIYEIPSPYVAADLTVGAGIFALDIEQSGDVLYIANATGKYCIKKLTRHGPTRWIFTDYAPVNGPFLDMNATDITLTASATGGSIGLSASAALFVSTDVGRLVRLESQDFTVQPWEAAKAYTAGDRARFNGKTYRATNTTTSGTSPPDHDYGFAYDGKSAVNWAYENPGYGVARITAVASGLAATATVLTDIDSGLAVLPNDVVTAPTKRWSLGLWSDTTGYPTSITQWRSRLWWGQGIRYGASLPDALESMAPDILGLVTTDCAVHRVLNSADVNDIEWICGADELVIGTGGGEFVVGEISRNAPLGPENIKHELQSKRRTMQVKPEIAGSTLLYFQRAARKLLSFRYRFESDKYQASDLNALTDRITRSGAVGMCFQAEPYSILWVWLTNGKLLGFTYDEDQDLFCWHRHPLGGAFNGGAAVVESVVSTPAPDGSRDEITLIGKRTINGQTVRTVEYMKAPLEGPDQDGTPGDNLADAFYVDCGLSYSGAPVSAVSGLTHLEGQTVQVLADGAVQGNKVVTAGAITLDRAASKVHVGLSCPARLVKLRLEAGSGDGPSQGKIKRVEEMVLRLIDSLLAKVGLHGRTLDEQQLRDPNTPMGSPSPFKSGDVKIPFPGDYETDCQIEVLCDRPIPFTLAGMMPKMKSYP